MPRVCHLYINPSQFPPKAQIVLKYQHRIKRTELLNPSPSSLLRSPLYSVVSPWQCTAPTAVLQSPPVAVAVTSLLSLLGPTKDLLVIVPPPMNPRTRSLIPTNHPSRPWLTNSRISRSTSLKLRLPLIFLRLGCCHALHAFPL
ncbi:hypothetical protein OWV82_016569 [Melia azedarach]|uniref:Uncharacterized protein n=1 Tax=Melia azedarach TaxID=155640 RepID=A0ACC1XG28_MELAZ|nr:hypothetical protein OWV82_016569 [Melia azedarach]